MAATRVSAILQDGAEIRAGRRQVADAHLREENDRLNAELARLRLRVLDLERAADTDPLVPVYNRRAFMREVRRAQSVVDRYSILSSLIFFDLNGFKSINDRYGHGIGDDLLLKTADVLLSGVRQCDLVARLGGDEFGVILFNTEISIARAKAATLSCRIAREYIELPTTKVSVTASWGAATCDPDDSAEQVLARADRAMYMAKRQTDT